MPSPASNAREPVATAGQPAEPAAGVAAPAAAPVAAGRPGGPLWMTGLAGLAVLAAWLHWHSGYVFPWPWPDESHFIAPALRLADFAALTVPTLNAPDGIYWMPGGYYVAQVPLLWTGMAPLAAGRLLSLLGVVGFATTMAGVAARANLPRAVCLAGAAVWLCQPRVIAAGNIARMEGVLLGIIGLAVWLVATDRWPLALSVALAAPLVHPVAVVLPVAVAGAGLLRATRRPWSWVETCALALVVVLWAVQAAHFLRHRDVAATHLRFQLERKLGRGIAPGPEQRGWFAGMAIAGAAATVRWRRAPAPLLAVWVSLAMAGGLLAVEVVGRELWYEVLGRETAVALVALAVGVAVTRWSPGARHVRQAATAAVVVLLVLAAAGALRETLVTGWFGMRPDAASREEWNAFVADAVDALARLDAAVAQPALVVVDPNSGFGQEVFARRWQRLEFVQPTPATPMETRVADYVVTTPGAPSVTHELAEQWGPRPPDLRVASARGAFAMDVYANPAVGLPAAALGD